MDQVLIEQVMTRSVETVPPDCPIGEVISRMHERRISCVVVAEELEPLGVITERDVVRLLNLSLQNVQIPEVASEAMSSPPLTVTIGTNISDAMAIVRARGVRHIPIVDPYQQLVGIATQTDLLRGYQNELERRTDQLAERTRKLLSYRDEVEELSFEDKALDVGNWRAMDVVLAHTHLTSLRHKRNYAIVLVSLDHIDEYRASHDEKDVESLLREVTGCLNTRIRRTDQIFRFGNDAFLALLPEASLHAAVLVATRSQNMVSNLFSPTDDEMRSQVGVRVGYASFDGTATETAQDWKNVVLRAEYSLLRPGDEMQPSAY